jgi:hypothetical protein
VSGRRRILAQVGREPRTDDQRLSRTWKALRVSQTHHIEVNGDLVTKTYVDSSRGEHLREWNALRAVSDAHPTLVPTPIQLTPGPSIIMTRIQGRPLTGRLTGEQTEGLRVALTQLWSIPPTDLQPIDHAAFVQRIRTAIRPWPWPGSGIVADAQLAATAWLSSPEADELSLPAQQVLGHGDPNLANYLWDGSHIRIVDFEDAGRSDLTMELANLVEHIASRGTHWTDLVEHFATDRARLLTARRLFAIFWLTLLRPGGPSAARNPPGTSDLQAKRVLDLLRRE